VPSGAGCSAALAAAARLRAGSPAPGATPCRAPLRPLPGGNPPPGRPPLAPLRRHLIWIYLEGGQACLRDYLTYQRTVSVDVDSKGRKCRERMMDVLAEAALPAGPGFEDFRWGYVGWAGAGGGAMLPWAQSTAERARRLALAGRWRWRRWRRRRGWWAPRGWSSISGPPPGWAPDGSGGLRARLPTLQFCMARRAAAPGRLTGRPPRGARKKRCLKCSDAPAVPWFRDRQAWFSHRGRVPGMHAAAPINSRGVHGVSSCTKTTADSTIAGPVAGRGRPSSTQSGHAHATQQHARDHLLTPHKLISWDPHAARSMR
jgi:hypothetical protein